MKLYRKWEYLAGMNSFFFFLGGLAIALLGAECLIRSASHFAKMLGISSLVIGLTIVGYGTSSPELAVSAIAAHQGEFDLSIGNIVGSNIFNILGVLGMMAAVRPLKVHSQIVKLDLPVMLFATGLLGLLLLYSTIPVYWGWILLLLLFIYTTLLLFLVKKETTLERSNFDIKTFLFSILGMIAGLSMLIYGSKWLIQGAVDFGHYIGISERIIGLTIVAIGTSIPEIVASFVALYKKQVDLAVGNIVGSNIYNILAILGVSLLASKSGFIVSEDSRSYDLLFLLVISFLVFFLLKKGHHMSRKTGYLFLTLYVAYLVFILEK